MNHSIFKYLAFLIFIPLIYTQCQTTKRTRFLHKEYKSIYIDQFKLVYFKNLLIKSYNNSKAIQEIINLDQSGFTEPVLLENDYQLIDSLTTLDNKKMQIDSTLVGKRAEGAKGKRALGFIQKRLNSKWLDSLANNRYMSSEFRKKY